MLIPSVGNTQPEAFRMEREKPAGHYCSNLVHWCSSASWPLARSATCPYSLPPTDQFLPICSVLLTNKSFTFRKTTYLERNTFPRSARIKLIIVIYYHTGGEGGLLQEDQTKAQLPQLFYSHILLIQARKLALVASLDGDEAY